MKRQHDLSSIYSNLPTEANALHARYGISKSKFVQKWISHLPEPMHLLKKCPRTNERDAPNKKPLVRERENNNNHMDFKSLLMMDILDPIMMNWNPVKKREVVKLEESESNWTSPDRDSAMDVYSLVEYPPDCVAYGKNFLEPSHGSLNTEMEIEISDIAAPMRFWFTVESGEDSFAPQMKEMERFYEELEDGKLHMASTHVFPRQICAVKLMNSCARGVIQSYLMGSTVKVFLVDFGCRIKVSPSCLKYLKSEFMRIPRQAFRGALANVKPIEPWTSQANREFSGVMCQKRFIAHMAKIEDVGGKIVWHWELQKPNSKDSIGKLLIDKGLAVSK